MLMCMEQEDDLFVNLGGIAGVNALVPVFQGQGLFLYLNSVKELVFMIDGWWRDNNREWISKKQNNLTFRRNLS